MADPAKLELLRRTPGDSGFKIYAVESSQAYLLFRPARLPEIEWELTPQPRSPDGSRHYILRNLKRDRYLLLSPQEYFLWEQFDGHRSLDEIGRAFHFQFGSFDYSIIRQFMAKLYSAGLLEEFETSGLQRSLSGRDGRWWACALAAILKARDRISFRVTNADHHCLAIYNRGGFLLFHPFAFAASLALLVYAIIAVARLAPQAKNIALGLTALPLLSTGVMIAVIVAISMLHVLAHALACKSYGRKVREMGFFFLQGIIPTFYADVTDIFMTSRKARVIVDLAGPMVEVVCGSLAFIVAYWSGPGIGQSLLFGAGVLLWESAVLNIYPFNFLEMDGYNILADLLAMPALRQQALKLIPTLPRRLRIGMKLQKSEWIALGYLTLCFFSVLAYLIAHLGAMAWLDPGLARITLLG
jgi:putative peptide zinc metalloprotease protein